MVTTIKTGSRTISVGDKVYEDGKILLDVSEGARTVFSDAPLIELLAALSKIPGVTATYEKPLEPTVPERLNELGLGAVFTLAGYAGSPKYIKVGADKYTTGGHTYGAYDFHNWSDFELLSEGYKP